MRNVYQILEQTTKRLTKEWERSGETKQTVELDISQLEHWCQGAADEIKARREILDCVGEGIPYMEILEETHECYILLRAANKLDKALKKAVKKNAKFIKLKFDKEEFAMIEQMGE